MKLFFTFFSGIAITLLSLSQVNAQQLTRCYTDEVFEQMKLEDPTLEQKMEDIRSEIDHYLAHNSGNRSGGVITIPVVFHIIHNGEPIGTSPNISDAQIISQLEVLTADFRRLNSDTANTPAAFKPIAADILIQFELAKVDPTGQATSGIVRHDMGQAQWSSTNDIDNNLKPQTTWDADIYFNMWSINMDNGILGYATFPGTNANRDGIVLDYRYVGKSPINPGFPPYNQGRTATHEVGHYLGLRHIWGDGGCGVDDGINDTPESDDSNYGCSSTHVSCNSTDMVQNYMDYSNDACMNLFTEGQKSEMLATMATIRANLANSPVLIPQFTYSGQVVDQETGIGVPNAKVLFEGSNNYIIELTTDSSGFFNSSTFIEEVYTVYAGKWGYMTELAFVNQFIDAGTNQMIIAIESGRYYDDFIMDFGWTVTGDATAGIWERDVPVESLFNTDISNPGIDGSNDFGNRCYVTGNGGGAAGSDDVDDGNTIVTSPIFDITGMIKPHVTYQRWFYNGGGNGAVNDDALTVYLTNGLTTIGLESITTFNESNTNQWKTRTIDISSIILPTANMQFYVETSDLAATGHIVDAGLDRFEVYDAFGVGIEELPGFSEFLVYPNPSNGMLHIEYEMSENTGNLQIDVINMNGQIVHRSSQHDLMKDHLTFDLSTSAGGIYFIRFNNGSQVYTKRVTLL